MSIVETVIPITLDMPRKMRFSANTMVAFETATGKFFLDTLASLYTIYKEAKKVVDPNDPKGEPKVNAMEILRKISMKDLRALVWASLHEYDNNNQLVWPLTEAQVGRYINLGSLPGILTQYLNGYIGNIPNVKEMGESPAPPERSPAGAASQKPNEAGTGGERSIELPVDAFV